MSARKTNYTNNAQQRILKVLLALFGNEFAGLSVTEISKQLTLSMPNVVRDLDNLHTAGLAEQDQVTGRWRLTPRLPQKALVMLSALESAQTRLDETRNRYTRHS